MSVYPFQKFDWRDYLAASCWPSESSSLLFLPSGAVTRRLDPRPPHKRRRGRP